MLLYNIVYLSVKHSSCNFSKASIDMFCNFSKAFDWLFCNFSKVFGWLFCNFSKQFWKWRGQ